MKNRCRVTRLWRSGKTGNALDYKPVSKWMNISLMCLCFDWAAVWASEGRGERVIPSYCISFYLHICGSVIAAIQTAIIFAAILEHFTRRPVVIVVNEGPTHPFTLSWVGEVSCPRCVFMPWCLPLQTFRHILYHCPASAASYCVAVAEKNIHAAFENSIYIFFFLSSILLFVSGFFTW